MATIGDAKIRDFRHIHFVGAGGIGMSALARLCLHEGKIVSGSDRSPSLITDALVKEGVEFFPEQKADNIQERVDLVVFTEAMPKDHEELIAARERGILTMNYFEALGMVANEYYLIAVAGTHGKTTTTSMLIDILEDAGLDPTAVVGSLRSRTGSNFRAGKSKYFIVEACEYKRDFLSLWPDILVITNIEHEHVDYYQNLADVQKAFRELAERVPEDGYIVTNLRDDAIRPSIEGLKSQLVDYTGYMNPLRKLLVPGIHNQMNAAAALTAAAQVGVNSRDAETSLAQFKNSWRRFEYKGEYNGAPVYDDYGHHPTEVRATIQGARELYPDRRLVLVFQPHTYTRAHELFEDFVKELGKADRVLLAPIYAAREANESGVSSDNLAERIRSNGSNATAYQNFDDIVKTLKEEVTLNDLVLVMGAGNITDIAAALTNH